MVDGDRHFFRKFYFKVICVDSVLSAKTAEAGSIGQSGLEIKINIRTKHSN